MGDYSSYYLYRKYEITPDALIPTDEYSIDANGTMPAVIKEECAVECGCEEPTPPTPTYVQVEYVENTGNSTVNLGVQLMQNAGNTFSITLDNEMSYTSGGGSYQTFLTCCKEVSPYPGWYYRYAGSTTNIEIAGNVGNFTTARTLVGDSKYHVEISSNGVSSSYVHNYPLNLFSSLDGTQTPWRFCKGKLYGMEVTYNGTMVRKLIPVKRSSDNVAGLYDQINDVFYTSASGYDALVAGQEV